MSKGSSEATVSTYRVGLQMVLGHGPFDSVDELIVDEKSAWTGSANDEVIYVDAPELFGGNDREGGIQGYVEINMGLTTQSISPYLASLWGSAIPAFQGLVTAVARQVYVGTNYYFKPWAFLCTRIHVRRHGVAQWQDALAEIGVGTGLINAIHVIRECLTDKTWGLGVSEADINEASFLAAAQTCYGEGLGFAWLWATETSVQDFIADVEKHIQCHTYRDAVTNQYYIILIRKLASQTGLVVLDESNIKEVSSYEVKSVGDLTYSVTVKFINNDTHKDDAVPVFDAALFQRQNGVGKAQTITYSGVASTEVAYKLAARDQWQLSLPVRTCTILCNRAAEGFTVGTPFVLDWPDYMDAPITMRVLSIDFGASTKQQITIEATEDFFHAADAVYLPLPPTGWVDPITYPVAVTHRLINEAPYYMIATRKGDTFAQAVPTTEMYLAMAAVSPTQDSVSAGLWTNSGGSYARHGVVDFCFSALLTTGINKTDTTLVIDTVTDQELLTVDHFIQLGNELIGVTALNYTTGILTSLTVIRGVLDTVPEEHLADVRMFGWHDFSKSDDVTYLDTEVVNVKLTTITPKGELAIGSAPEDSITMTGRMHMPYAPGNLQIGGSYWPISKPTGSIILTWAHRNRIQQTAGLIGYYTASITTEPTVTYGWELIRTDTLAVLDSGTGITADTDTITTGYVGEVKLTLWSLRDTLTSWQTLEHTFDLT